jgi:hypothetical protein
MEQPDLSGVVRARIHPCIGIARIGDSAEEFLIGPEVPEPPILGPAEYTATHRPRMTDSNP